MKKDVLYVIYEVFGGACSERQALMLDEVTPEVIEELIADSYLKRHTIDGTDFLVCRHSVYIMAGNDNQNYRLTTYNLKKSCLIAEWWLLTHKSTKTILTHLQDGTMHQRTMGPWGEYIEYLHNQDCYVRLFVPETMERHFVWFSKSQDPLTVSKWIKKFFNEEGFFDDIAMVKPVLSVQVRSESVRDKILKRFDGRDWWMMERFNIFVLRCEDTRDLI